MSAPAAATRTAVLPLTITCPEWCTDTPAFHPSEMEEIDGACIHHYDQIVVDDSTGFRAPLREPRFAKPISLQLTTLARPSGGREIEPPVIHMEGGSEVTIAQALDLGRALTELVAAYRQNGGIEWVSRSLTRRQRKTSGCPLIAPLGATASTPWHSLRATVGLPANFTKPP